MASSNFHLFCFKFVASPYEKAIEKGKKLNCSRRRATETGCSLRKLDIRLLLEDCVGVEEGNGNQSLPKTKAVAPEMPLTFSMHMIKSQMNIITYLRLLYVTKSLLLEINAGKQEPSI